MTRSLDEVADGVYRLGSRWVNFYLVVEDRRAILIDAGYPGYLTQLDSAIAGLGKPVEQIAAVLVTHHHVDHAGTAEAVRSRDGATIFVGAGDTQKVRGEDASHPPSGFYRHAWRPSMIAYLVHTVRAGGARYRPVAEVASPEGDAPRELPGRPRVIPTPGHTAGHYSVLLEERGVLFTGDAMVNFDYAAGETGLRLHRFNEDREGARAALDRFDGLEAETLLFGHGEPWNGDLGRALELVREGG